MRLWTHKSRKASHFSRYRSTLSAVPLTGTSSVPEKRANELCAFLRHAGPWYQAFALYLSSRIDVLPAEYCREFATVPDLSETLPEKQAREILLHELGERRMQLFAEIDWNNPLPALMTQSYRAKLKNDDNVEITLLRPEFYELPTTQDTLAAFDIPGLQRICGELVSGDTVSDFLASVARKTNLAVQADAIQSISENANGMALLRARRVFRELCSRRVLVVENFSGHGIHKFLEEHPHSRTTLAAKLCHAWLHLAFTGNFVPVHWQEHRISVLEEGSFLIHGCDFVPVPQNARQNFKGYLLATAEDEPDNAAAFLLREMLRTEKTAVDTENFRSGFRQAAQFGVLEPVLGTDSNALAQLVFQQCKTAMEHGYRPQPHLLAQYRGLFSVARIARSLAPLRDSLREGLEEFRISGTLDEVWDLAEWTAWTQNLDKFATAMANLPRIIDQNLPGYAHRAESPPSLPSAPRERNESNGVLVIAVALAAALLASQFQHFSTWTTRLAIVAVMLAGLQVLRRLGD